MTPREELERVMLDAMKPWRMGTITVRAEVREFNVEQEKLRKALDAAEAAGFEIKRKTP